MSEEKINQTVELGEQTLLRLGVFEQKIEYVLRELATIRMILQLQEDDRRNGGTGAQEETGGIPKEAGSDDSPPV